MDPSNQNIQQPSVLQQQVAQPVQQQSQGQDPQLLNVLSQLQQQVSGMNQKLNTPVPPTAEQVQAQRERLLEEFNSNPDAVLSRIQSEAEQRAASKAQEALMPAIDQMKSQMQAIQWSDATRKFIGSNPNSASYVDAMSNIINTNPMIRQIAQSSPDQALKMAYSQALAETIAPNGDVVSGIMSNESLKNQILTNPDIQKQIIEQYVASLNGGAPNGGAALPPIAGNGGTPGIAPTQVNKPKTMQEAQRAAEARIATRQQSQMQ